MLLSQLEYFVAVAREKHFGRAAAACYISQSALSESIRKLELELGVPLIRRGRSFEGLTAEGELAVIWARRILADDRSLRADVTHARSRLTATVVFGVVPSAVNRAGALLASLARANSSVQVRMRTAMTTQEILQAIRHFELDGGLVIPGKDDPDFAITPLHQEPLVVLASVSFGKFPTHPVTGRQLAELPLALLDPHMRARQLLDQALAEYGVELAPTAVADSVEGLLSLARTGHWATIVPRATIESGSAHSAFVAAELVEPTVSIPIALARLADEPRSPVASALLQAASEDGSARDRTRTTSD